MKSIILIFALFISNFALAGDASVVVGGAATGAANSAVQNAAGKAAISEGASKGIGEFFDTPPGILLISGIATVYSGMLYQAAAKQEEESDANIKKIDRIMAEFKDSYLHMCPNGRDDLKDARCYCYTADGKQNADRTRSQTCIDLWAKDNSKVVATAGDYSGQIGFVDPVGCVTLKGQFDEGCKCKKFIDGNGNNACQKAVSINIPNQMMGTMANTGVKDVMQLGANAGSGNPNFNGFGDLSKKALNTEKIKAQLMKKLTPEMAKQVHLINAGNVNKAARMVFGDKAIMAALSASPSSATDIGMSNSFDPKTNEMLKQAASKAGLEMSSGRGLQNKKAENKEGFKFDLGDGSGNGSQAQNFPDTQKQYKVNDISKQPDTSIFEIISNRYIQSGLKRLFEE